MFWLGLGAGAIVALVVTVLYVVYLHREEIRRVLDWLDEDDPQARDDPYEP